jgi:hypothetical protein
MSASQILKHLKPENVRSYNCSLMNFQATAALTAEQFGWPSIDILNIDAEGQELNIITGMLGETSTGPATLPPVVRYEHQGVGSDAEEDIEDMLHKAGYFTCAEGADVVAFRKSWDLHTFWKAAQPTRWSELTVAELAMCGGGERASNPPPPSPRIVVQEDEVLSLGALVDLGSCAALAKSGPTSADRVAKSSYNAISSRRWVWNKNFPVLFDPSGRLITDISNCGVARCTWAVSSTDSLCVFLFSGAGTPPWVHSLSMDNSGSLTGVRDIDQDGVTVSEDTSGQHTAWFNFKAENPTQGSAV